MIRILFLSFVTISLQFHQLKGCDCSCRVLDLGILLDLSTSVASKTEHIDLVTNAIRDLICRFNTKHTVKYTFCSFGDNTAGGAKSFTIADDTLKNIAKTNFERFLASYNPNATSRPSNVGLPLIQLKSFAFKDLNQISPKILIILSDGFWNEKETGSLKYETQINDLLSRNVEIFAVTTSDQLNYRILKNVVSKPVNEHIFSVKQMSKLLDLVNQRTLDKCDSNVFTFFKDYNSNVCDYY